MVKLPLSLKITVLISLLIRFSMISGFAIAASQDHGSGESVTETKKESGTTSENSDSDIGIDVAGSLLEITATLSWNDNEDAGVVSSNEPDNFHLSVTCPGGDLQAEGDPSDSGTASVTFTLPPEAMEEPGEWTVTVHAGDCGDIYGVGGIRMIAEDNANQWDCDITYTYIPGSGSMSGMGGMGGMPFTAAQLAVINSPIFKVHIALMIASTFLFLFTGLFAGVYLFRSKLENYDNPLVKAFRSPKLYMYTAVLVFIAFFLASVPIGMWVAGGFYGWDMAWSGMPAFWNEEAWSMTNADNVSLLALLFWIIPMYINRREIMYSKPFLKFFGKSKWVMGRAAKARSPIFTQRELALIYFILGIFIFTVFAVQPHG
jgi:hypothetical protein